MDDLKLLGSDESYFDNMVNQFWIDRENEIEQNILDEEIPF